MELAIAKLEFSSTKEHMNAIRKTCLSASASAYVVRVLRDHLKLIEAKWEKDAATFRQEADDLLDDDPSKARLYFKAKMAEVTVNSVYDYMQDVQPRLDELSK